MARLMIEVSGIRCVIGIRLEKNMDDLVVLSCWFKISVNWDMMFLRCERLVDEVF